MKRRLLAALLLAGCAKSKPGDMPDVRYGADLCARCGMAVTDARFASGYVDAQGDSVVFDDVGEFLDAAREEPSLAGIAFVHDAEDGRWLAAAKAFYVQVKDLATPMGSGFAAFASRKEASSFAGKFQASSSPLDLAAAVASRTRTPKRE